MLSITNLHAKTDNKEIIKGLDLEVKPGQVHAIMGPNGAGKSTLTGILSGNPSYKITKGKIEFLKENLLDQKIEERAKNGLFIGFQNPVEIPGVNLTNFLKTALNEQRKHNNQPELTSGEFLKLIKEKIEFLGIDTDFYKNNVNEGLSGGQKKQSELLQMAALEPKLAVLDEIDSGLDVDSLKLVATNLEKLRTPKNSMILITHYQRLLNYIEPDFVHILIDGKIIKSGDKSLVEEIEKNGYKNFCPTCPFPNKNCFEVND